MYLLIEKVLSSDLIACTDNELMDLTYMSDMLLERCRMSNWVIVSKALVTFHSLLSNGNEVGIPSPTQCP